MKYLISLIIVLSSWIVIKAQSSAYYISNTYPDTITLGDTLIFETFSGLKDNGPPPTFCSPLYSLTDSLKGQDIIFDLTFDFSGASSMYCGGRKDTLQFILSQPGDYNLQCHWSWINPSVNPPDGYRRYGSDTIQIHVRNTTSIAELEKKPLSVFPNPVDDEITLSQYSGQDSRIEIIDLNGRILRTTSTINGRVSVADLEPGIYFLRIREKSNTKTMKFVKK